MNATDDPIGYALNLSVQRLRRARAAIDRVRVLHPTDGTWCLRCWTPARTRERYPCPTIRAITGG